MGLHADPRRALKPRPHYRPRPRRSGSCTPSESTRRPSGAGTCPWKTFLQAHWEGLATCDLFTVEVLTLAGLRRYLVFFVIELTSRHVTIAGIHPQPGGAWMEQQARNVTDPVDRCLRIVAPSRFTTAIPDLYCGLFGCRSNGERRCSADSAAADESSITTQDAERFVRSIKDECLTRVVPLGEGHHASPRLGEYIEHVASREKPPGTRQPAPATTSTSAKASDADVRRRVRLGGLLSCATMREAA